MFPFQKRFAAKRQNESTGEMARYRRLLSNLAAKGDLPDGQGSELEELARRLGRDLQADADTVQQEKELVQAAEKVSVFQTAAVKAREDAEKFDTATQKIIHERGIESTRLRGLAQSAASALGNARDAESKLRVLRANNCDLLNYRKPPVYLLTQTKLDVLGTDTRILALRRQRDDVIGETRIHLTQQLAQLESEVGGAYDALMDRLKKTGVHIVAISPGNLTAMAARLLAQYEPVAFDGQDLGEFNRIVSRLRAASEPVKGAALMQAYSTLRN